MSLMHWYRQMTGHNKILQEQLKEAEERNHVLQEEIKELKKILYHVELDYTAKILRK